LLRPERVRIGPRDGARMSGLVADRQYFGSFLRLKIKSVELELAVDVSAGAAAPAAGAEVHLHWDESAIHRIDDAGAAP
ncbi:MAG: TOBE domain-containing protein, partial [Burkholderiales bacterium]